MVVKGHPSTKSGRTLALENIPALLASDNQDILFSLIDNPSFDETHVCLLLDRKDLHGTLLEEISKRKTWRGSYRVRLALAAHPHTPRLIAMRLLREVHLMDLVRISLLPTTTGELRHLAEERVLTQVPQLPLGQKLTLARRGSSRVAAGLIAQGPENVARIALDNAHLTEPQLLKALATQSLTARIVAAVAKHEKWSKLMNIRVSVLRHAHAPVEFVPVLVADLPRREIEDLLGLSGLAGNVRAHLRQELARRNGS
jgi:hypothetical protein